MRRVSNIHLFIAVTLILIGAILRIVPHPPNFAPVAALALFGGAILPQGYGVFVPLVAMIVSDAVIGFHDLIFVTWASYALIAFASQRWLRNFSWLRTGILTVSGSLFFFLVTNFAVWISSGMYAHTLDGLVRCYALALPFFRSTLASDIFYTAALFGLYGLATNFATRNLSAQSKEN